MRSVSNIWIMDERKSMLNNFLTVWLTGFSDFLMWLRVAWLSGMEKNGEFHESKSCVWESLLSISVEGLFIVVILSWVEDTIE